MVAQPHLVERLYLNSKTCQSRRNTRRRDLPKTHMYELTRSDSEPNMFRLFFPVQSCGISDSPPFSDCISSRSRHEALDMI